MSINFVHVAFNLFRIPISKSFNMNPTQCQNKKKPGMADETVIDPKCAK